MSPDEQEIVADIRAATGITKGTGPSDDLILGGVKGFVAQFDYWYIRVVREAVPEYRNLIIKRINPFIRRIDCYGLSTKETATRLVEDWRVRNLVTAGGWALEEMAAGVSAEAQKSSAEGIDIQRHDKATGDYHLYVLKSGLVTRNADILKALKRNSRQAERLLLQGKATGKVHAYYAIAAGKNTSSFEDGIWRPSSAEFWSHMFGLSEEQAIDMALAIAAEAGRLVQTDAVVHLDALKLVVGRYIETPGSPDQVDWEFIATRTMRAPATWKAEDKIRHSKAIADLKASGYSP